MEWEEYGKSMDPGRKRLLDDLFDAFSMLAGGNFVSIYDVKTGVTRYSPGAVDLFGLAGEYIPPEGYRHWLDYVHPEDRKRYLDVMETLTNGGTLNYDLTYRVRTRAGDYVSFRFLGAVVRGEDGVPSLIGGMMINEGLVETIDPVTVMSNHHKFFRDLSRLLGEQRQAVILLVGMNRLSQINAIRGYSFGNRVLQQAGWIVQETIGARGEAYRMDGASFAVLSTTTTRQEMAAVYDTVSLKLQRGVRVDGIRVNLTTNGGLVSTLGIRMNTGAVFSCLRHAYTESKERSHGELVDYNGGGTDGARESLELISAVRGSIIDNCTGFYMQYQPVYDIRTDRLIGAESLLRWRGEPFGDVATMDFLPILEKDYIFEELGGWILRQTLSDGMRFLEGKPEFLLGVNISPIQIEDEYFVETLLYELRKTGFPAGNLCLELTKGCRRLDPARLGQTVEQLRREGIRFLVDDFGTGLASLEFLKGVSADYVKLDMQLMRNIEDDPREQLAMEHLARLAALYGPNVCVKGVETRRMREILQAYPIQSIQGNLVGTAQTAGEFAARYHETLSEEQETRRRTV